ncbi:hypothetical protein VaNZ11_001782 [Volvox africanus]|uniref:HhH-GPD domain-containing protein n=1 Tax=Volvox africanus TaxID=51714 RepID=A0ABQ5RQJ2_9CHLO|nr:hypothetical protein VaNZ11_001782 [Volvox africanus]
MRANVKSMRQPKTSKGCKPTDNIAVECRAAKEQAGMPITQKLNPTNQNPQEQSWFTHKEVAEFRLELLKWYDHNHRVLPWRRTPHSKKREVDVGGADAARVPDAGAGGEGEAESAPAELPQQQFAYWVWVSEVMLQQTQVATVIPYFKRWVAKWPTVADLAAADIDTVNALWAGLGYYRRARYLLDGARFVVEKLDGRFPHTPIELVKIPGVGPYTSAAVASIAFGSPAAAVDGNVIRVVSRLRALPGDPTKLASTHAAMASELLDPERPGCYNQALMELGATVCRPINPDCAACPVRGACRAAAEWEAYLAAGGAPDVEDAPRVTNYPGRKAVKEKRQQAVAVTVLEVICTAQPLAASGTAANTGPPNGSAAKRKMQPLTPLTGTTTDATAAAAAGMQRPPKRQRTMQDFALAAAARKQQQQQQQRADVAAKGAVVVVAGETGAAADKSNPEVPGAGHHEPRRPEDARGVGASGGGSCSGGGAGGGGGGSGTSGDVDLEVLVARGARHYLLTMRPQDGLLAGLWEFPGAIIPTDARSRAELDDDDDEADNDDDDAISGLDPANTGKHTSPTDVSAAAASTNTNSSTERQRLSDALLRRLLGANIAIAGPGAAPPAAAGAASGDDGAAQQPPQHTLCVLARHDMGKYVHVFSHIRQTNYIQRVTAVFHGDIMTLERLTAATATATAHGDAAAGTTIGITRIDSEKPTRADNGSLNEGDDDVVVVSEMKGTTKDEIAEPVPADAGADTGATGNGGSSSGGVKKGQGRGKKAAGAIVGKKQKQQNAAEAKAAEAAPHVIMWASRQQVEGSHLGLSSGVKKIFQQAVGASDAGSGRGGRAASMGGKGGANKAAGAKGKCNK